MLLGLAVGCSSAPAGPSIPLTAPSLEANLVEGPLVQLSWSASASAPATVDYRIERAGVVGGADPTTRELSSIASTSRLRFADNEVELGWTYAYRVVPTVDGADGPASNVAVMAALATNASPETEITVAPNAITFIPCATFEFTGSDDTGISHFECRFDGVEFATCESPLSLCGLALGIHTLEVRAVDSPQGEPDPSPASVLWGLYDNPPPDTTLTQQPAANTTDTFATFAFVGTDDTGISHFECDTDGAGFAGCVSPVTLNGLAAGNHTFSVRAVDDPDGQVDPVPAQATWTVLNPPPDTTITQGPPATTPDASATFVFSGTDDTGIDHIECGTDGAALAVCVSPHSITGLGEGAHTFEVQAVDAPDGQADPSPAIWNWTIENPPDTLLYYRPATTTPLTTARFAFGSLDLDVADYLCALDGAALASCATEVTFPTLSQGLHSFSALAEDAGGNRDPVPITVGWRIVAASAWRLSSIAAASQHVCGVGANGSLWCWGTGTFGRLGTGGTALEMTPVQIGGANDWQSVATGRFHSCGIRLGGNLWCWGYNAFGQLGTGSTSDETQPALIGGGPWAAVSAGAWHTCAIDTNGAASCWGYNQSGRLGDGTQIDRPLPTPVFGATVYAAVSAGSGHTCALRDADGEIECWGSNSAGQLGDGTAVQRCDGSPAEVCTPLPINVGGPWLNVSSGGEHVCAVAANNAAWCWGSASFGQTGHGESGAVTPPSIVGVAQDWETVSAAATHTCARRSDGSVHCWGDNASGQLGLGEAVSAMAPTQTGHETAWLAVSASDTASCGLRADATVWCWGDAAYVADPVPTYIGGP